MSERVQSGVPGLDEVLLGGLVRERSYLLIGPAGAGKTILSIQWLLHGVSQGERCMFVTLVEPSNMMANNVAAFGWSLDGIEILDLTSESIEHVDEYGVFSPSEVERAPMYRDLYEAVERFRPQRLVIDSLTQLRYLSADEYQFRKQMMSLVNFLARQGCTSILAHEPHELSLDVSAALAVDGVIRLRREQSSHRTTEVRSVQVEKLRGSDFRPGQHHFRFTGKGIHIYPHRSFTRKGTGQSLEQLSSGIKTLDALLGGGVELGTTTLLSGPTGVGKSTLAALMLGRAVAAGNRGVYLSFEEAPNSILLRNEGIGIMLRDSVEQGDLILEYAYPRQYFPDELFSRFENWVDQGFKYMVIDGVRGYKSHMEVYGEPITDLQNLVSFLVSNGVTPILTNEVEVIAGELRATEVGVSHLADNLIMMRYAEYSGEVIKIIGCLKKRLGPFQPELRELRITAAPTGLEVGPKLQHLRGILSGTPTFAPELHQGVTSERPPMGPV